MNMKSWKEPSMVAQAAVAMLLIQVFFKLIFEVAGAKLITDMPVLQSVYILTAIYIILIPLCLAQVRWSFIIGVIFGVINAVLPIMMLVMDKIPAGYSHWRPVFVLLQNLLIAYFCWRAYKRLGIASHGQEGKI